MLDPETQIKTFLLIALILSQHIVRTYKEMNSHTKVQTRSKFPVTCKFISCLLIAIIHKHLNSAE